MLLATRMEIENCLYLRYIMPHTIVLVQHTGSPSSRTFQDFESVAAAMDGDTHEWLIDVAFLYVLSLRSQPLLTVLTASRYTATPCC